ncbi:efflux RND transporter periplasmic adaptor subunit [Paenibacillus turpanensis]|uniref:efflux RND transporter periplasmic adaptor subunit n=1 Tax=Paenibacillus turpanensis TaxID=2689078 RepID=UPI001FB5C493|nr:efflux RND transporter periplasmic adaptor subunit [Paenibacillus turpanensis]
MSGCSLSGSNTASVQLKPREIQTEPVQRHTISAPIEQVAEVVAGTKLDIAVKVNGEVQQVLKQKGEFVKKDEVLFIIDSTDAESALRKSELALRNAQQTLQQTRDNAVSSRLNLENSVKRAETAYNNALEAYNKIRNEFDSGLATQHQVDQQKQALDDAIMSLDSAKQQWSAFEKTDSVAAAQIQVESATLSLEDAKRNLNYFHVKAPGDGILTDYEIVPGQNVSASAGSVGKVQLIDPIKIKTALSESQYKLVQSKQELVYYDPDLPERKETAKVSYLAPIMSANSKTYTLELEVSNTDLRIQPGKRYMVQLTTENEENVVAIPILSIIREESDTFVFVQEGSQYRKRFIALGRQNGEYQEVIEGLQEGENLVVVGQNSLKDGQPVEDTVTSESAPAPAGN